jgi:hypothetical protein
MVMQIVGDAFTVGHKCQRGVVCEVTHQIKIIDVGRLLSFAGDGNDSDDGILGPRRHHERLVLRRR